MESSGNAVSALHHSLWLAVSSSSWRETGLIEFKCTWYKRESRSLARTSALDFNKEGCVIQIWAD